MGTVRRLPLMSQRAMSSPESADCGVRGRGRGASARIADGRAKRRKYHEHGAAAVEAGAVGVLPDVLDLVRVPADEAFGEVFVRALDRLGVALERAFAPADEALFGLYAHEEPARGHAEYLDRVGDGLGFGVGLGLEGSMGIRCI